MNRKEFFVLTLITFFTVIAWIIFDLYHAKLTSTISVNQKRQIVPLTPTFDNDIIKKLKNREE